MLTSTYIKTYMCTNIHTYVCTYLPTYMQTDTCLYTYMHTYIDLNDTYIWTYEYLLISIPTSINNRFMHEYLPTHIHAYVSIHA